jgi:hypothetical protein
MYFKTTKDSETGQKFTLFQDKWNRSKKQVHELLDELNAESARMSSWYLSGGIKSFQFKYDVEVPQYLKKGKNGHTPRMSTPEGKKLSEKIDSVESVTRMDLNDCIGYDDIFSTIGFNGDNTEYFLFTVGDDWKVKIPKDCTEILASEYKNLSEK